jgi:hypothetical protein
MPHPPTSWLVKYRNLVIEDGRLGYGRRSGRPAHRQLGAAPGRVRGLLIAGSPGAMAVALVDCVLA